MADELLYIPNDVINYPLCRFQLVVETFGHSWTNGPTNQNSIKVPKVVRSTNKKTLIKTLLTYLINSLMSLPLWQRSEITRIKHNKYTKVNL